MKYPEINNIIGKKILCIRGVNANGDKRRKKYFEPVYILFDDKKTLIKLTGQDYYSYRDCSGSARYINVLVDKKEWKRIHENKLFYPKADMDI